MKRKITRYLITIPLLLLLLVPLGYFLIFPNYNTLIGTIQRIDTRRIAYDIYFSFLIETSPTKEQVLGTNSILVEDTSIEEYLDQNLEIDPILEELDTKLTINSVNIEGNIFQGITSKTMDK